MSVAALGESLRTASEHRHRDGITIMAKIPGIDNKYGMGHLSRLVGDLYTATLQAHGTAAGEQRAWGYGCHVIAILLRPGCAVPGASSHTFVYW